MQRRQFLFRASAATALAAIPLSGAIAEATSTEIGKLVTPQEIGCLGKIESIGVETHIYELCPGRIAYPFENRVKIVCKKGSIEWLAFNLDLDKDCWRDVSRVIGGIEHKRINDIYSANYKNKKQLNDNLSSLTVDGDVLKLSSVSFNYGVDSVSSLDFTIVWDDKTNDIKMSWIKNLNGKVMDKNEEVFDDVCVSGHIA